ncbi:PREDICTED: uncharacterized protein LOC108619395 [Drosophila arizonae]|uniref:Uncharacterized protein LOC108619395 n=1 Tax=Drosophila arizonae TaxID=7263 RepID=A0ABM1PW61_DROAR|nr:PREDICTED: uncharacterized protein LOC108619395 [Drosophila arizonae]
MAVSAIGSLSSKLSLGLLNFVLVVSSGWALKHYSIGRYALAAYGLLFAHSLFCILHCTHPNPGQVQRRICELSLRYSPVIFVTLIVGQLQSFFVGPQPIFAGSSSWHPIVFSLYISLLALVSVRSCLNEKSKLATVLARLERLNLALCVLWNVFCLWHIAIADEFWWSLGLALLVLLNHFVLWRLTLRYNISPLEVGTVGMCFSVIFGINAAQEMIESRR